MKTYTFVKDSGWYIDLPEYIEQGGSKGDLAMVAGADTMLDRMAGSRKKVTLTISTEPFPGSDRIQLQEVCAPSQGGGYYYMEQFEGQQVKQRMWLCAVTNFVFGGLLEQIYVRRVPEP